MFRFLNLAIHRTCGGTWQLLGELLPPVEVRVGLGAGVAPFVGLFGKAEVFGMGVTEEDVIAVFAEVIVPLAVSVDPAAPDPEWPISGDYFVGCAEADFGCCHGYSTGVTF